MNHVFIGFRGDICMMQFNFGIMPVGTKGNIYYGFLILVAKKPFLGNFTILLKGDVDPFNVPVKQGKVASGFFAHFRFGSGPQGYCKRIYECCIYFFRAAFDAIVFA